MSRPPSCRTGGIRLIKSGVSWLFDFEAPGFALGGRAEETLEIAQLPRTAPAGMAGWCPPQWS